MKFLIMEGLLFRQDNHCLLRKYRKIRHIQLLEIVMIHQEI